MANMIVTEFLGPKRAGGQVPAAYGPLASQTVAIGGSSAATPNALSASTALIQVYAEADCNICIAAAPDASTGVIIPMGAGQCSYFTVDPTSAMKVAVIERTVS